MQNKLGIWLEVVLGSTKIKVSRNNWNCVVLIITYLCSML